ncbi:MAG TPA: hypothetical protein ENN07_02985 [candidate division Zixibacteria bacterium]|nr:hypothetical protein [candidate division Zixibacteria bacterium]
MKLKKFLFFIFIIILAVFSHSCAITKAIKSRTPPPQKVDGGILFRYQNPAARQVQLCGNFNNWCGTKDTGGILDPSIGIMTDADGDGIWEIVVDLPPGRYQYKFVVDRVSWTMDPSNPDTDTEDGIENSLIIVK